MFVGSWIHWEDFRWSCYIIIFSKTDTQDETYGRRVATPWSTQTGLNWERCRVLQKSFAARTDYAVVRVRTCSSVGWWVRIFWRTSHDVFHVMSLFPLHLQHCKVDGWYLSRGSPIFSSADLDIVEKSVRGRFEVYDISLLSITFLASVMKKNSCSYDWYCVLTLGAGRLTVEIMESDVCVEFFVG